MAKNQEKEKLLEEYINLARKLGKLPTRRETDRFICSDTKVNRLVGTHNQLKELALSTYPDLEQLKTPVRITRLDVNDYRLELEKKESKKQNSKIVRDISSLDYIEQFADRVFSGKIPTVRLKKNKMKLKRTHTLVLSDLHIGADLKGSETGAEDFGVKEESRRLASIVKEAVQYKPQYRKETKLVILLLGDVVEGQLHDPRTGATQAEQSCRAIHLLLQAILFLSKHYPEVEVYCATGNHDRNTARHKSRAVHQKFDSFSTIIYYGLKKALASVSNISFTIPTTPLSSYYAYGKRIGYTHGDTVINPGNPGSSVNVRGLEHQVNRLNAALNDDDEYAVIVYGHTHIAHMVHLSNGTVLIGNGSLPPPDHFAVSMGIYESNNGQYMFESVPGHPVGDTRLIKVKKEYDSDISLDKIIKPWDSY